MHIRFLHINLTESVLLQWFLHTNFTFRFILFIYCFIKIQVNHQTTITGSWQEFKSVNVSNWLKKQISLSLQQENKYSNFLFFDLQRILHDATISVLFLFKISTVLEFHFILLLIQCISFEKYLCTFNFYNIFLYKTAGSKKNMANFLANSREILLFWFLPNLLRQNLKKKTHVINF